MHQRDRPVVARVRFLEQVERTVVEDVAVLVDLDQSRALMGGRVAQHRLQVLAVGVERAGDERRLRPERYRDRVEGRVDGAHWRRLGDLAELRSRRVLPLGQAVDLVVEQQNLQVDVAAQRVDQVVAADRERITVTRHDPYRQVPARRRQSGRDGRRTAVDRMHAERVHVVREA